MQNYEIRSDTLFGFPLHDFGPENFVGDARRNNSTSLVRESTGIPRFGVYEHVPLLISMR